MDLVNLSRLKEAEIENCFNQNLQSLECAETSKIRRLVNFAVNINTEKFDFIEKILQNYVVRAFEPHIEDDLRLIAAEVLEKIENKSVLCWIAGIFLANDELNVVRKIMKNTFDGLSSPPENFKLAVAKLNCFTEYDFLSDLYQCKTVKEVISINPDFEIDFLLQLEKKYLQ